MTEKRGRAVPLKCPACGKAMNQIYYREKNVYKPIGWICKKCGYIAQGQSPRTRFPQFPQETLDRIGDFLKFLGMSLADVRQNVEIMRFYDFPHPRIKGKLILLEMGLHGEVELREISEGQLTEQAMLVGWINPFGELIPQKATIKPNEVELSYRRTDLGNIDQITSISREQYDRFSSLFETIPWEVNVVE